MNERIKEIAEQANIEFTYDPTEIPMRAFAECWDNELEKFAHLIVKECIGVCDSFSEECAPSGETHSNAIKEHFGVEYP